MKTICPPGYHHNGFVATHALGDMMYIHTRTHTHTHTHTYIYICIYIYACMYVCMYRCIHI